jgi:O-antigen/teichoic acid export membrane protein
LSTDQNRIRPEGSSHAAPVAVSIPRNLVTNLLSNTIIAVASFIFVPVYLHVLGMEVFGLIGLFTSIQVVLSLLDLGLSAAANRELARLSADASAAGGSRQFLRSLEVVYWFVGIALGLVLCVLAPLIAKNWVTLQTLTVQEAQYALTLMAIALAARWPFTLYVGALYGLERQALANGLRVLVELVRSSGAAAILLWISPTLQAFLIWQIGVCFLASIFAARLTWRVLPPSGARPQFDWVQLRRVWRYMAGVSGISITVVVLTQTDKFILSKLLPLELFGYYALAWAVANALTMLTGPVFSAYFPSFARAVAKEDQVVIRDLFHRSSQAMAAIVIPTGVVLVFFSREILNLWTQDAAVAQQTHLILSVLVLGTVLNGLMNVPYALVLAHGWTSLPFFANTVAIVVLVPLMVFMTKLLGAVGAALAWLLLNLGHLIVTQHILHRRILPSEKLAWYKDDVAKPLVICTAITALARFAFPEMGNPELVVTLAAILLLSQLGCLSVLQHARVAPMALARRILG